MNHRQSYSGEKLYKKLYLHQIEQIITDSTNLLIKECYDQDQICDFPENNEQEFQCVTVKGLVSEVSNANKTTVMEIDYEESCIHSTREKSNSYGKTSTSKLKNTSIKGFLLNGSIRDREIKN